MDNSTTIDINFEPSLFDSQDLSYSSGWETGESSPPRSPKEENPNPEQNQSRWIAGSYEDKPPVVQQEEPPQETFQRPRSSSTVSSIFGKLPGNPWKSRAFPPQSSTTSFSGSSSSTPVQSIPGSFTSTSVSSLSMLNSARASTSSSRKADSPPTSFSSSRSLSSTSSLAKRFRTKSVQTPSSSNFSFLDPSGSTPRSTRSSSPSPSSTPQPSPTSSASPYTSAIPSSPSNSLTLTLPTTTTSPSNQKKAFLFSTSLIPSPFTSSNSKSNSQSELSLSTTNSSPEDASPISSLASTPPPPSPSSSSSSSSSSPSTKQSGKQGKFSRFSRLLASSTDLKRRLRRSEFDDEGEREREKNRFFVLEPPLLPEDGSVASPRQPAAASLEPSSADILHLDGGLLKHLKLCTDVRDEPFLILDHLFMVMNLGIHPIAVVKKAHIDLIRNMINGCKHTLEIRRRIKREEKEGKGQNGTLCVSQSPPSSSVLSSSPAAFLSSSSPSSLQSCVEVSGGMELGLGKEKEDQEQLPLQEEERKLREGLSDAEPGTWMFGEEWHKVVDQISSCLYELAKFTTEHYPFLKTTQVRIDATVESIAGAFFGEIHPDLMSYYGLWWKDQNEMMKQKYEEFSNISPDQLGIPKHLWLRPGGDQKEPLFIPAIAKLRNLESHTTAPKKLDCLVSVASSILACVTDYWVAAGNRAPVTVGGDELLPLLIYVMLKGRAVDMYSEAAFMQHFIDETSAIQKQGYLLATVQTSLGYIAQMTKEAVEQTSGVSARLSGEVTKPPRETRDSEDDLLCSPE